MHWTKYNLQLLVVDSKSPTGTLFDVVPICLSLTMLADSYNTVCISENIVYRWCGGYIFYGANYDVTTSIMNPYEVMHLLCF